MKFLQSKFGNSLFGDSKSDSRPDSRGHEDSRPPDSKPELTAREADEAEALERAAAARAKSEARMEKRKALLRVVLAKTIQKTGVPAAWIGGELNPMVLPNGEEWIEIRLALQIDEPRLLTYLSSFQAELERRLLAVSPDAKEWLAGIAWKLNPDAIFEMPMPQPEFWEHVQADRLLTSRQKGATEWDRESLERHFTDTNPGELVVDFEDTNPPDRQVENLARPLGKA